MRIGFFVWEFPPLLVGGLGTYAENITRKFVELDHDVSVFTLNSGNLPTREIIRGVEIHRPLVADASNIFPIFVIEDIRRWGANIKFFNDVFIYNILCSTKFANELIKKEGYKFDIVCIHDWLSSVAGIIIKNELKMPMIFHVHSTEWGRANNGSEVVKHLETAAAQMADGIITVSHTMKDDLTRHGWPEAKISAIWNGIDPEKYDPKRCKSEDIQRIKDKYGVKGDERILLFIGRLTWVKSVRNLIQAMPLILNEFPNTKLIILGRGEEQRDIMELAQRLGIADKLIYRFEFIPESERILHYAAADVCVFPSIYEPFGIVSLEAMAMEKPVVVGAYGVVGFREQVIPSGPGQNGVHVNGRDPSDIAWGVKETLRDPERAKKWGENGRKRILQYFTWEKVAEQTIAVYEDVLK